VYIWRCNLKPVKPLLFIRIFIRSSVVKNMISIATLKHRCVKTTASAKV